MSREIVERYFAALETGDAETIGETLADDVLIWRPAGEIRGRAAAVEHFAGLFRKWPDTRFRLLRHLEGTESTAFEWEWKATGGKGPFRIFGVDWMESEAGKIRVLRFYYDPAPLAD